MTPEQFNIAAWRVARRIVHEAPEGEDTRAAVQRVHAMFVAFGKDVLRQSGMECEGCKRREFKSRTITTDCALGE